MAQIENMTFEIIKNIFPSDISFRFFDFQKSLTYEAPPPLAVARMMIDLIFLCYDVHTSLSLSLSGAEVCQEYISLR